MRKTLLSPALVLAALLAVPTPAAAWLASNGYVVNDVGNGQFEVKPKGQLSDQNAWCAAGDYAMRRLGYNGPVWRISPPPRRAGKGIVFSTSSAGAAGTTGMATIGGGGSMGAAAAQSICNTLKPDRNNR